PLYLLQRAFPLTVLINQLLLNAFLLGSSTPKTRRVPAGQHRAPQIRRVSPKRSQTFPNMPKRSQTIPNVPKQANLCHFVPKRSQTFPNFPWRFWAIVVLFLYERSWYSF